MSPNHHGLPPYWFAELRIIAAPAHFQVPCIAGGTIGASFMCTFDVLSVDKKLAPQSGYTRRPGGHGDSPASPWRATVDAPRLPLGNRAANGGAAYVSATLRFVG